MSRTKTAIVVDSTAYLPEELVDQYNLHVIPLALHWAGESLLDGVDILPADFYQRLKESEELPTTSQPSVGEFFQLFSRVAQTAESIVGIFISGSLSGTAESAQAAAAMMGDYSIEIVDSRFTTMGLGFMALAAARAVEKGMDSAAVAQVAHLLVPHMRVVLLVDTLEYLHRGGRIGGAQRLFGSMLAIKPILHLKDGRIEPLESVRTKRKAVNRMLDLVEKETRHADDLHVALIKRSVSEEANLIFDQVRARLQPVELIETELGPAIGTHTGPGTLGIIYYAAQ